MPENEWRVVKYRNYGITCPMEMRAVCEMLGNDMRRQKRIATQIVQAHNAKLISCKAKRAR